jgi:hypothetical protein
MEAAAVQTSELAVPLPIFLEFFCDAHRSVREPIPLSRFQVVKNFLRLTFGAQMHVSRFRAHRGEKYLFVTVLWKRLDVDGVGIGR